MDATRVCGHYTEAVQHPMGNRARLAGRIYVADTHNNRIVRMDDFSGAGWTTVGTFGDGPRMFSGPTGIAFDAQDRLYIADSENNRIVRMDDMTGRGWITYGVAAAAPAKSMYPGGSPWTPAAESTSPTARTTASCASTICRAPGGPH